MKLLRYEAHNVLGVNEIKFDLEGRHLFLVGGANGQGKTSAITAMVMALCGRSGMGDYPDVALKRGKKKGKVVVELSGDEELMDAEGFTAELSWRQKASGKIDEEFRLLDSSGAEAPEPRTLLKRLFELKAFDPLAFERMKPKEQAKTVQDMLGVDVAKYDEERAEVYEKRRQCGVEGKKLAAKLEGMTKHAKIPKKAASVAELMEEMETIQAQVDMRLKLERAANLHADNQAELTAKAEKLTSEIDELKAKLESTNAEIAEEEKAEKAARTTLETDPQYADRSDDMASLKERIATADETNRKIRENEEHAKLSKE
ncbi:MAG: AAA family ATPase, partial [Planctomycetota bacterium]